MILAVRMAVEGMVEELINADADINATDEYGIPNLYIVLLCIVSPPKSREKIKIKQIELQPERPSSRSDLYRAIKGAKKLANKVFLLCSNF